MAKHYEGAVLISPNSFLLNFFALKALLHNASPKYFHTFKISNNVSATSGFYGVKSPLYL